MAKNSASINHNAENQAENTKSWTKKNEQNLKQKKQKNPKNNIKN